jgi:hypothetical protein
LLCKLPEATTSWFALPKKEAASDEMGNPLSKEGKWLLCNLPEIIYFFFSNPKKKVKPKERFIGVTGFEPATSTSRT